ncbi:hypothetical protein GQ457_02G010930 [Hibiscus cannabinus]
MSNMFMAVIHYDGEILKTDIGVVFDSDNTTKMRFSKNISLQELKNEIERKIGVEIVRLRYRWKTSDDPIRYSAITLKDDDDVGLMIAEHDSMRIRTVELHVKLRGRYDGSGPSINVIGSSSQMGFDTAVDDQPYRFGESFVALLESGTSDAFHPSYAGPSTFQTVEPTVDPSVGIDLENLQGRWGETLADSSEDEDEDEETVDPDLSGDDLGNEPVFGGGEFVSAGNDITWYEPPSHMNQIDYDVMRAPEFSIVPQLGSSSSDELSIGMQFKDKEEATLAIKEYSIRKHVDYSVKESNLRTMFAKCVKYGADCSWKIRVSKLQRRNAWEITKYNGGHTCLRNSINQDHRKLDSDVISRHVKNLVEANPRVTVATIQSSVKQQFEYQIEYGKGWYARDKALKMVYGNYEKSYNELPALLQAMTYFIPGTIVRYKMKNAINREGQIIQGKKIFHQLFWAFKPCIEGFPFCKRMVQVDGTWLYGRYKHVLLVAVTQDGDRNIFPIAFAIVESESANSWKFFLRNLREHVVREDGVCLISDRAKGILATIDRDDSRWTPPHAYPAYCVRHIGKNAIEKWKKPHLRIGKRASYHCWMFIRIWSITCIHIRCTRFTMRFIPYIQR